MRAFALFASLLVLLVAACSNGDDSASDTTTPVESPDTSAGPADGADGEEPIPAFIDIVECENAGGAGSGSGTIENQGETATAYEIEIAWVDDASGEVIKSAKATTEVVEPGAAGEWTVTTDGLGDAESVTCRTVGMRRIAPE